ncbi:MAG: ankyrin repeat domain-containing protein [Phycisphaerae bacterium]|nr:ankyrin repeat domain-containing protein [Phycisphaerae bacterium]
METYLTQITNYLLMQSWQIAVLVVVIAAATFALRNRSAHVRYLLWLIVLAKCLVPPLLEVPVAVLPERVPVAAAFTIPLPAAVETMPETTGPLEVAPIVAPVVPSRPQLSPRQWIVIGWLAGVLAFACIAAVKAGRTVRWLRRDRRPLSHDVQTGVNDLLSPLGLRRLPRMWLLEGIGQPFVWGAVRGDIYLPASFVRIPDDGHRRHVLGHELGHVMRFDAAVNLVQIIAQSVFWFHPLVWWANRRIRAEREKCCDEMAIARLNAQAKDYTRAIVETLVTEYESTRPVPSLAIAGPVRNIEERIKIMLKPGKKFYKHASVPVLLIVGLIALLAVPTALVLTARAGTAPGFGNPTNLGPSVNSSAHEYDPSISADELELYFNSYRPGSFGEADIWMTTRKTKADPWGNPVNLGLTVNSPARELAPSISADGLSLYFSSDRSGGYGVQDIWVTTRETKSAPWGEPVNLGPTVNSVAREHAPSISTDGLELYFSGLWEFPESSRPGGSGKADIWVTARKTKRDPWGTPVNLGPAVNSTTYDESPSISGDGLSLYFYSHRSWGSGKSDIWVTKRKSTSDPWGAPVNLGPTVNSVSMGGNPDISRDGSTLYFASRRPGGLGGSDLWQLSLGKHGAKENSAPEDEKRQPTKSLQQAAADGDLEQVKLHISSGADVNAKDQRGRAAVHRAAYAGHIEVVRLLIEHGADVNVEDKLKRTPLEHAAVASRTKVVKLLIEEGANPNARNEDRATPLHVAASSTDKDTVRLLIDEGADVTLKDAAGKTPLHAAMMSANPGRREIVDIIVATGKVPSTIHLAAYMGDLAKVKTFIEEGVAVNEKGVGAVTALHCAAAGGRKEVAELLLAHGADVNARETDGMTPLQSAVYCSDDKETIKLLIANGSDVNATAHVEGETGMSVLGLRLERCVSQPIELADAGGKEMNARVKSLWNSEITRLLTSKGARFGDGDEFWLSIAEKMDIPEIKELAPTNSDDDNKEQPKDSATLHQAAADGDLEQIKLHISKGADVNTRDENARTPLIIAADEGQKNVVELLLSNGAEVEARDDTGATALHHAAIDGYLDIVEVLLEDGADVNAWKGDRSWAAIHAAIQLGYYDIVKLLIDKGADINTKCNISGTPLETVTHCGTEQHQRIAQLLLERGAVSRSRIHTASFIGDVNSVKELIEAGTDVNKKGCGGRMPLHCAAVSGQNAVMELLLARGANVNARGGGNLTPLHEASGKDQPEAVALLIAKGADLNARDYDGDTPLHLASRGWGNVHFPGSLAVARLLLNRGAEIDARNKSGETPLHRAAESGFKDVVQELLEKGADVNIQDSQGLTALGLAKQEDHTKVIELLRKHGAKEKNL